MSHIRPFLACLLTASALAAEPAAAAISATVGAAVNAPAAISLAGPWRAVLTHALPPAPSYEQAHPATPISPEALAAVRIDADASGWDDFTLPGTWDNRPGPWLAADGEAVFRREVTIPEALAGRDLELRLGTIDDIDDTYVNGVRVGGIGKQVPGNWAKPRIYRVPGALVKAGPMVIAVRVFDVYGGGGFTGAPGDMVVRLVPPRVK